jgi:DNA-directed RNA polymerase specialized sigma24 family protein
MNDVKEYLSRYHNTKVKIQKLQALVDEYIRLANEIPGIQFDAIRVDGGKNLKAPFEKWILKTLDYELEIKEMERLLPSYKKEVLQAIEQIEDKDYRLILVHRYIDWLSWRQIADRMFFSSATIRRWHDKALLQIELP